MRILAFGARWWAVTKSRSSRSARWSRQLVGLLTFCNAASAAGQDRSSSLRTARQASPSPS